MTRCLMLLLLTLTAHLHSVASEVQVFILAGQSNAVGFGGNAADLPSTLQQPQDDVLFWYDIGGRNVRPASDTHVRPREGTNAWVPLRPQDEFAGRVAFDKPGNGFTEQNITTGHGVELTLGRTLADALPEDIGILKYAWSGTSLGKDPALRDWNVDSTNEYFDSLIAETRSALDKLSTDLGKTGKVAGFFWMQGGADANPAMADLYQDNLSALIDAVREEWGQDLPFIFTQEHHDIVRWRHPVIPPIQEQDLAKVRAAQQAVANLTPMTRLVNTDDIPLANDWNHFNSSSLLQAGERLGQAYLMTVPEPSTSLLMLLAATTMFMSIGYRSRKLHGPGRVAIVSLVCLLCPFQIFAAPHYKAADVWPKGPEYTRADGLQTIDSTLFNTSGHVAGVASVFNGMEHVGQRVWLYNGSSTQEIGLKGPEFTGKDGGPYSHLGGISSTGLVGGITSRYNAVGQRNGLSAWLYNGVTAFELGLTGDQYIRPDGYKNSQVISVNDSGQVFGHSVRVPDEHGIVTSDFWLFDGASTRQFEVPEGTAIYRAQLSNAGQVYGSVQDKNGNTYGFLGDLASFEILGLSGPEFTRKDGTRSSWAAYTLKKNDSGQIVGESTRFNNGLDFVGQGVWIYDGSVTKEIGLTGPGYTRSDGYRYNELAGPRLYVITAEMNDAGQTIGHSNRFDGDTDLGRSAWLYDGETTVDIGLVGPEFVNSLGYRDSQARLLNDDGWVAGYAWRYGDRIGDHMGITAWLYDGVSTKEIGLQSAEFHSSNVVLLNNNGQAIGSSFDSQGNEKSWLYDATTQQTITLPGEVYYLGDDGVVLGSYTKVDASGSKSTAYYFSQADGLIDLHTLIDDPLSSDLGLYPTQRNAQGQILAGRYLLTPVPEPSGFFIAAGAFVCLALTRKRAQ